MAAPPLIVVQVWDHDLDVAREDGYRFFHPLAISVSSVSVSGPNKSGTLDSEAATKSSIICMHPATLHG
uniref:Uncharacterized protein n=1 Tax=Oryza glumipatula TaxID=40148 RepID=A0A0E0ALW4_9ORYZ